MIGKSIQLSPEEGLVLISILQTEVSLYGPSKGLGSGGFIMFVGRVWKDGR